MMRSNEFVPEEKERNCILQETTVAAAEADSKEEVGREQGIMSIY
jgi:hypothetical protein